MANLAGRGVTADRVITAALVGLIGHALGLLSDLPDQILLRCHPSVSPVS